jgi:hypothetical protein
MSNSYDQFTDYGVMGRRMDERMQARRADKDTPDAPVPTEVQQTLGHYLYRQIEGPLAQGVRQAAAPHANPNLCAYCRRI